MWKKWKFLKYWKPTRSQVIALVGSVFIIIGVTILFFGTPYKPNADAARSAWTFAAPFLAAGLILYAADFFIKR
jgi:hypothetical protein